MLLAFENVPVINADALENPVPVQEAVIVHGNFGVFL
jgi:hypothetical protein